LERLTRPASACSAVVPGVAWGDKLLGRHLRPPGRATPATKPETLANTGLTPLSVDAKGPQKKDKQSPAPAPLPSVDAELTDGPKH
jgi:hypothetical protein